MKNEKGISISDLMGWSLDDDQSGVDPMTRDELDEYDFTCERCGKPL